MNPKILIGIPTYSGKAYCESEFFERVLEISYLKKDFAVLIVDNTRDGGEYAAHLKATYPEFKVLHFESNDVVYKRLFMSHEEIRLQALKMNVNYLLHLESDVIPPKDIIQRLLLARKSIVSPLYHLSLSANRHLVQRNRQWGMAFSDKYSWGYAYGHANSSYVDGTIKRIQTSGIGCILIHKSVLTAVPFRYRENVDSAPDSAYAKDLLLAGYENFCDTGTVVKHLNSEDWGQGNINLLEKYEGNEN